MATNRFYFSNNFYFFFSRSQDCAMVIWEKF